MPVTCRPRARTPSDGNSYCALSGDALLILCLPTCHPCGEPCPPDEVCVWSSQEFICLFDAGALGRAARPDRPGGRDEDDKCVVTPDVATLLLARAAECRLGLWELATGTTSRDPERYVERRTGRLLSACRERTFPVKAAIAR